MDSFSQSTLILDNLDSEEDALLGPRVGQERYVSYVPTWQEYLIVPVQLRNTPLSLPGAGTLPAPIRIAATAYTATEIPPGTTIWKWPPDKS